MRHLYRNIALILIVLGFSALAIYPPERSLRLGKDLAGGVSLLYTIELKPEDPPEIVGRVIEVLSDRINPDGVFEISFVRQGRDRLEVTMPLPSAKVQALRNEYEDAVDAMVAFELDSAAIERALRLEGDARVAALEELVDGSDARRALIDPIIEASRRFEEAKADFERSEAIIDDPAELLALQDAAGAAQADLLDARDAAVQKSVSPERIRQTLLLPNNDLRIRDTDTGEVVTRPSPRQRAIENLREKLEALPGGSEAIERVASTYAAYVEVRTGLDDPDELKRMLQGAGVLEFRIAVRPGEATDETRLRNELETRGPGIVSSDRYTWAPINKEDDWINNVADLMELEANPEAYFASSRGLVAGVYAGQIYILLSDEPGLRLTAAEGEWALSSAFRTTDDYGRPAIGFNMDPRGALRLGSLTEANINRQMAVLLDNKVYTAPTLQGRISDRGRITGSYSEAELVYLIKTLNAGSLQARLSEEPISVTQLAPELGADNLRKGVTAGWIALGLVGAFMIFYYFSQGFIAMVALIANAVIILGAMSLNRAAFTLPGIAGIILTFGMAVDANVLIYERLREELLAGNDLKTAVRISYQKVLSTIVDANVTNLIVCVVLGYTATQEIKGFAITLGIGVVATMFSALLITRVIFSLLVDKVGMRKMTQLPMAIPLIDRILTPKIDWIGLRPLFLVVSIALVGTGLSFIFVQRGEMLDTEFRGGTAIDLRLATVEDAGVSEFAGAAYTGTLTRAQVEETVHDIGRNAEAQVADGTGDENAELLAELRNASIIAVETLADGVSSDWFKIKTTITEEDALRDAIVDAFAGVIDSRPALTFRGSDLGSDDSGAPIYPISKSELGANLIPPRPEVQNNVEAFSGGAIVLLEDIQPRVSEDDLRERLEILRREGSFSGDALRRDWSLIVIDGSGNAVETAAIVVRDPQINVIFDEDEWERELAASEWLIAREALATATTLAGVQNFSAEVAASFRGRAIVAVMLSFLLITIYIWVRFGSWRYSIAALSCLVHDVITAIGLIALAEILYKVPAIAALGIQPYRIDLGLVAAILTIIGYSLNDTIIILDRIRENRGKLAYASREVVNLSINQTISRTVITSGTTLLALITMFLIGGEGIGSFTYALICGVIVGTYSSIAVAAPLVYTGKIPAAAQRFHRETEPADDDGGGLARAS
jgi:SecD/SecF fusion protein